MAQLTDDCFAFGGPLMPIETAIAMIAARVTAIADTEQVDLRSADGRVLAFDIKAGLALPPFTNSAVDGYALCSADLPVGAEKAFPVIGRVQAGSSAGAPIAAGHAVRIFTGAPMPSGADTVFMQEDIRIDADGRVVLPPGLKAGANVRPAGEDIARGEVALPAGRLLRPQDVALIAGLGLTEISVIRRLRVAVFSTGNEVVAPGSPRGDAQLYDTNRFMLAAMLTRHGCHVSDLGILRDDPAELGAALKAAAAGHDLVLTSGGVSTGEEDHVKRAVEQIGSLVLWRMAIKPGRPVAMGVIDGVPFIGLPGNPVASFVTFTYVVAPTLAALSARPQRRLVPVLVRAGFSYRKKLGRREYVRANLRYAADGVPEAIKFARDGAGLLSSLVNTDGLVELNEQVTDIAPGDMVSFLAYDALM